MTQFRWSNDRQVWVFEADLSSEAAFRTAALDALIEARLHSRRRIHDGGSRRNYYWYDSLHLDVTQDGWLSYATVLWVPHMQIWTNIPSWIQEPPYDTAEWYRKALKTLKHLENINTLCDRVAKIIEDSCRRPDEW